MHNFPCNTCHLSSFVLKFENPLVVISPVTCLSVWSRPWPLTPTPGRLVLCQIVKSWAGVAASDHRVTAVQSLHYRTKPNTRLSVLHRGDATVPVFSREQNSVRIRRTTCAVQSCHFIVKDCLIPTLYWGTKLCKEPDTHGNILGYLSFSFFHIRTNYVVCLSPPSSSHRAAAVSPTVNTWLTWFTAAKLLITEEGF